MTPIQAILIFWFVVIVACAIVMAVLFAQAPIVPDDWDIGE